MCLAPLTRLPPARPYSLFAEAHAQIVRTRGAQLREFWKTKLRHVVDLPLLSGAVRGPIHDWRVSHVSHDLPHECLQSIVDCSLQSGATLGTVILAAYGFLLMRCAGLSDIVVSCAVTLRERSDFAAVIGYLVNSVPVVIRAGVTACFADLCRTVRGQFDQARGHADYAQHLIGRELPQQGEAGPVSLLSRYAFNFLDERSMSWSVQPQPSHPLAELQLTVRLRAQSLRIELSALAERYERGFLEQLTQSLTHLLTVATRDARRALRDVGILSAGQTARLRSFAGAALIPNQRRLDEWIGSQAALRADGVAVTTPSSNGDWEHLTYSALSRARVGCGGLVADGAGHTRRHRNGPLDRADHRNVGSAAGRRRLYADRPAATHTSHALDARGRLSHLCSNRCGPSRPVARSRSARKNIEL